MAQAQDRFEDTPDSAQNSPSSCLHGCGPCWYFGGCYRATKSSGPGASLAALPAPRRQPAYKRADSSALLTGGWRAGGGDHGHRQCSAAGKDVGRGAGG